METASGEPNRSRPARDSRAGRALELMLWLRTLINVAELARRLPQMVANATASPAIKLITGLAVWVLHTIADIR